MRARAILAALALLAAGLLPPATAHAAPACEAGDVWLEEGAGAGKVKLHIFVQDEAGIGNNTFSMKWRNDLTGRHGRVTYHYRQPSGFTANSYESFYRVKSGAGRVEAFWDQSIKLADGSHCDVHSHDALDVGRE